MKILFYSPRNMNTRVCFIRLEGLIECGGEWRKKIQNAVYTFSDLLNSHIIG